MWAHLTPHFYGSALPGALSQHVPPRCRGGSGSIRDAAELLAAMANNPRTPLSKRYAEQLAGHFAPHLHTLPPLALVNTLDALSASGRQPEPVLAAVHDFVQRFGDAAAFAALPASPAGPAQDEHGAGLNKRDVALALSLVPAALHNSCRTGKQGRAKSMAVLSDALWALDPFQPRDGVHAAAHGVADSMPAANASHRTAQSDAPLQHAGVARAIKALHSTMCAYRGSPGGAAALPSTDCRHLHNILRFIKDGLFDERADLRALPATRWPQLLSAMVWMRAHDEEVATLACDELAGPPEALAALGEPRLQELLAAVSAMRLRHPCASALCSGSLLRF